MALGARLPLDPPSTSRQPSLWAVELLRFSPRATLFDVASGGAQFANNSAGDLDGLVLPVAEPLRISNSKEARAQTLRMEHLISLVQVSMSTARQSMTKRIFRLTCPAHRTLLLPRSLLRGGALALASGGSVISRHALELARSDAPALEGAPWYPTRGHRRHIWQGACSSTGSLLCDDCGSPRPDAQRTQALPPVAEGWCQAE
jgi:hypothetical protein